jgi:hypothetical protein
MQLLFIREANLFKANLLVDTTSFTIISVERASKENIIFCLPVSDFNLKEANWVSVDQANVGGNVNIDGSAAVGV